MDNNEINIEEIKEENKEEKNMKLNLNKKDNNKKIIVVLIIIIILLLLGVSIYFLFIKKDKVETKEVSKEEVKEKDEKIYYVACDDNTSSLNVRNSTSGDVIDSLSCFKEVKLDEELEETETCKKWYKISYTKNNNSYTGYACGTYIKENTIKNTILKEVKDVVKKATEYYDNSIIMPWCGKTTDSKEIEYNENGHSFKGYYSKSEYKTLEELKEYLLTFLDSSLINIKLSDINNKKMYDDYYEIDGNLYCRNYSDKNDNTSYTGNYDIEIVGVTDDKINVNIAYEYINEETLKKEDSKCTINTLSSCYNSNLEHKLGKITIKKVDDKYIITSMDFHK